MKSDFQKLTGLRAHRGRIHLACMGRAARILNHRCNGGRGAGLRKAFWGLTIKLTVEDFVWNMFAQEGASE
jgi:hypothetical protein